MKVIPREDHNKHSAVASNASIQMGLKPIDKLLYKVAAFHHEVPERDASGISVPATIAAADISPLEVGRVNRYNGAVWFIDPLSGASMSAPDHPTVLESLKASGFEIKEYGDTGYSIEERMAALDGKVSAATILKLANANETTKEDYNYTHSCAKDHTFYMPPEAWKQLNPYVTANLRKACGITTTIPSEAKTLEDFVADQEKSNPFINDQLFESTILNENVME